jgi:alkylresorcinol/alkylpyrone synthase
LPHITGVAIAVPKYCLAQDDAQSFAREMFKRRMTDIDRLLPLFKNAGVEKRYLCRPLQWYTEPHSLSEKNHLYIEEATSLGGKAAEKALKMAGLTHDQIDYIIYINSTGLATPSIDARLINSLNLRHNIRRTPIWGLGCAGGAAGLSHAYHYVLGHRKQRILLVAVELCGLTFMADDFSKSNLVASALFGDGAAAAVISGDNCSENGIEIAATASNFFPDSLDVMGWNVIDSGLQVVFAQRIPQIVAAHAREDFERFLAESNLALEDIGQFILHPGGTKVLAAYAEALGLDDEQLALSRSVLADYGNMSSVTVLFVLERFLAGRERAEKQIRPHLVSALGPGFCSESLLLMG